MKNFKMKLIACLGFAIALTSLSGCYITEECTREGLTVYTIGWDQDYVSECKYGYWHDYPTADHLDMIKQLKATFKNCEVVACYDKGVHDCECTETYIDPNHFYYGYDN